MPILPLANRTVVLVTSQTVGGWALLINAMLALLLLLYQVFGGQTGIGTLIIGEALSLLLIVGLLALWRLLSGPGQSGRIGIVCLGLATGIAFYVRLMALLGAPDVSGAFPATSAVLGFVGSVLVGWATLRAKKLPSSSWVAAHVGRNTQSDRCNPRTQCSHRGARRYLDTGTSGRIGWIRLDAVAPTSYGAASLPGTIVQSETLASAPWTTTMSVCGQEQIVVSRVRT
jgi:hypothetical protein